MPQSKLAAAIRAKYPGAYDNVDDATLEKAVLAKYPQYQSLAQPEPAPSNKEMSLEQLQAANLKDRSDLPSTTGFLKNLATSTADFVAQGIKGSPRLAWDAVRASVDPQFRTQQAMAVGEGLARDVQNRYGSVDRTLGTAYHNPASVASDISALTGATGALANAANMPRVARLASLVSEATNPMLVMKPIAKATEYATAAAVRPMLKPSKALRLQSDAPLEIERTALKRGAVTEGLARRQKHAAYNRATAAADQSTMTTPRGALTAMPKTLDDIQQGLSVPSDLNTLAQVELDASASLPPAVDASRMLKTRRYLDRTLNKAFRAEERGGAVTGVKEAGQKEMLGNVRRELRAAAPGIAEADDEARRLSLVEQAIGDAGLRAGDVPMGGALVGAGLLGAGVPGAAGAGAAFSLGRTFPQIPLAIGSVPVGATSVAANPLVQRASLLSALIARLNGDQ